MQTPLIQPAGSSSATTPDEILLVQELHHIRVSELSVYCGVYFLSYKNQVVYVGQSVNVIGRIMTHFYEDRKVFDDAFFIEVPEENLTNVEGAYIRTIRPHYNTNAGQASQLDREIVNMLNFKPMSEISILPVLMPKYPEKKGLYWDSKKKTINKAFPNSFLGYGKIEISSRGYVYYKITLIYNRFTEDGNMAVYDVQVDIAGQPFFVLTDRVFIKTTAN